jgi:hypothetical protein
VTEPSVNWTSKYCSITNRSNKETIDQETKLDFGIYYGVCVHKNCSDQDIASILNQRKKNKTIEQMI